MEAGKQVRCPRCGGEVVAQELVQIGYEIATDGGGGWNYTGKRLYENSGYDDDVVVVCRECDWSLVVAGMMLNDNGVIIDEEEEL